MQLSFPRKCPDCDNGKILEHNLLKLCIICRGSGLVHLVPAEKPTIGGFIYVGSNIPDVSINS